MPVMKQSLFAAKGGTYRIPMVCNPADNPILADLHAAGLGPKDLSLVSVQVHIYTWMECYTVHYWMRKNAPITQLGENGFYPVPGHTLTDLKETCQRVLLVPSLADMFLPSPNEVYDDAYFRVLETTANAIKVAEKFPIDWEFTYEVEDQ